MAAKIDVLTQGAVSKILRGESISNEPCVVIISALSNDQVLIYDGQHCAEAALPRSENVPPGTCIVNIQGYLTSQCNHVDPFLVITSFKIAKQKVKKKMPPPTELRIIFPKSKSISIQGGVSPEFFSKYGPVLSNEQLASIDPTKIDPIGSFFTHHKAIATLPKEAHQHYWKALDEFEESQRQRNKTSLRTNTNKEGAARSNLLVEQYNKAIQETLDHCNDNITVDLLTRIHLTLCKDLHPEAGKIRKRGVKVGSVRFGPSKRTPADLETLCTALNSLEQRLVNTHPLTYASIVFFGIIDVHAFRDGNGRLGRIFINWALRKAGLPFTFQLFSSDAQRKVYTEAVVRTRRNLSLISRGSVSQEETLQAYALAGAFTPIVDLLIDCIGKTITEFQKLHKVKSNLAEEALMDKAAREFREKAAAGTCIICYDENPNIATLCCGQGVHLNCMANWLAEGDQGKDCCPCCRASIPRLPERLLRPTRNPDMARHLEMLAALGAAQDTESDQSLVHFEFETTGDLETMSEDEEEEDSTTDDVDENGDDLEDGTEEVEDDETEDDEETMDDTEDVVIFGGDLEGTTESDEGDDEGTTYDDDATIDDAEDGTLDDDDDDEEDTFEDMTTDAGVQQPRRLRCELDDCNNCAAQDCENSLCGRCCVLYGHYSCERHAS